jgi:hypothetical protein
MNNMMNIVLDFFKKMDRAKEEGKTPDACKKKTD